VDPHRQRQDRHPHPYPGPVRHLRALARPRPQAPRTGLRTGSPVPAGDGPSRRLGQDHPRHPGTQAPPRTRPVRAPNTPRTPKTPGDRPA
jgi:hypothetical protein